MKIENAIKEYCKIRPTTTRYIPTDEYGYWNVDIYFTNTDGNDDKTQMDVKPADFDYMTGKCKDLVDLWKHFCKENGFKQNSVESICIVGGW